MSELNRGSEEQFVNRCVAEIEEKLQWGAATGWSNFDFEKLSTEIQDETGVYLSTTTLKRVFGRIKYPHDPSSTTLNTLAAFLGHPDWREYKSAADHLDSVSKSPLPPARKPARSRKWLILLSLLVIVGFLITLSFRKKHIYDPADFHFSADKVYSEGVPNSVIFSYDATKAQTDSVFIVQTWDIRRKTRVPREGYKHSAIYYYPGFFRTKLIVEDQVMKTHDLQVTSNGWLALMELPDKPLYFEKEEILNNEGVTISTDLLNQYEIPLNPVPPKIRIFNQGDLGDLKNDNFIFETELKNDLKSGINTCQYVEVLIQCKDDIIIIPLVSVACVGDAYLYAAGVSRESKDSDLSGFGVDLTQWTHLKVLAKDKQMTFFVNGTKAESFTFPNQPTGVVGVQYRFNGPGAVKFARFCRDGDWLTLN